MTRLAVIVAVAENGVIGRDNGLPWHLPDDLRHFRRITMGKPIVMGRKTFESIGRPLPGRTNIVVSRNPGFMADGITLVASMDEALTLARRIAGIDGVPEAVVIGGAGIYALALPRADRLYITRVHARVEGDALLPPIDWPQWREVSREYHRAEAGESAGSSDSCDYSFLVYDRVIGEVSGTDAKTLPPSPG